MSAVHFCLGLLVLLLIVGPPALAGRRLRRALLPSWTGAPATLADVVVWLSLLFLGAHLVGSVGLFDRWPLIIANGLIALGVTVLSSGLQVRVPEATRLEETPTASRWMTVVAALIVAVVVAQWSTRIATAYDVGITDWDSLHYHLPHAAQFVQDGWLTRLHFVSTYGVPNMFHPSDSDLLHAIGMVAFGRDVLSPLLNLGWLGVAFLAGWTLGRPRGVGPSVLVAVAVVMAMPLTAFNAGSALSDVPSYACLLAAVALLFQLDEGRGGIVVAGAAAGLALSTKLTVIVPVAVLTVGVVILAARGTRTRTARNWLLPMVVTGSFWYLRNLLRTGSPLPNLHLGPLPHSNLEKIDQYGYSVAHALFNTTVWRDWFVPGLVTGMSPLWWLIAALMLIAVIGAALSRRNQRLRLLAVVVVVTGVAYVFTPTGAMGLPDAPVYFALNLRYVFPAVLLALAILPLTDFFAPARRAGALLAAFVVLFVGSELGGRTMLPGGIGQIPAWAPGFRRVALLAGVGVLAAAFLAAAVRRRPASRLLVPGVVVLLVATVGASYLVQRHYLRGRYENDPAYAWIDSVRDVRIAVSGFDPQYPFYGAALTNVVQYIGRQTPHGGFTDIASCTEWRKALTDGRYQFLVLRPTKPNGNPEVGWTRTDPRAHALFEVHNTTVYELSGAPSSEGCQN